MIPSHCRRMRIDAYCTCNIHEKNTIIFLATLYNVKYNTCSLYHKSYSEHKSSFDYLLVIVYAYLHP